MTPEPAKPLILIVDDTPTNIQVLAEGLKADYRVKVAPDGQTALDVAARPGQQPDLILLDVMMPGMDGYEVCRRLKGNEETQHIPVIFVTAKSDSVDEVLGFSLGAADYITKPFHLPIVRARIKNHINLKAKTDLLESLAHLDGLTEIHNRRHFDETLKTEWGRALRAGTPLALIMLDIDHFKAYNDHYGHGEGDYCLREVARTLSRCLTRPADLVARYGGEEFAAILPETDADGVSLIGERFRAAVEKLNLPHGFSPAANHVTLSVGCASATPSAGDDPARLLHVADTMLYQAKQAGRNRVCTARNDAITT